MTAADWVAIVLLLALTLYACSGIADFGAGLWDLLAGGRERGRPARELIDVVVTPVWEANHVWLIFALVTCWTAFGAAFASIMTTLFVPLALAALGIVLRGASFALRKDAARAGGRQVAAWVFGLGAVLTPFCFGAVVGALLTARVPPGNAAGNPLTSWANPTSIALGLLTVAMGAFLSAVYLVAEAARRRLTAMQRYFQVRALVAAVVGVALGVLALIALRLDEHRMFDRLLHRSWALVAVGLIALAATFMLARRGRLRGLRVVAVVGVAGLVWAWGVAQYPYLLPFSLTIDNGAGATVTQQWILVCFGLAVLLIAPALVLLYVLDQRGALAEDPTTSSLG